VRQDRRGIWGTNQRRAVRRHRSKRRWCVAAKGMRCNGGGKGVVVWGHWQRRNRRGVPSTFLRVPQSAVRAWQGAPGHASARVACVVGSRIGNMGIGHSSAWWCATTINVDE